MIVDGEAALTLAVVVVGDRAVRVEVGEQTIACGENLARREILCELGNFGFGAGQLLRIDALWDLVQNGECCGEVIGTECAAAQDVCEQRVGRGHRVAGDREGLFEGQNLPSALGCVV